MEAGLIATLLEWGDLLEIYDEQAPKSGPTKENQIIPETPPDVRGVCNCWRSFLRVVFDRAGHDLQHCLTMALRTTARSYSTEGYALTAKVQIGKVLMPTAKRCG